MNDKDAKQLAYEATRAHYAAGNPKATDGHTCVYKVVEEFATEDLPVGAQCAVGCRISEATAAQAGGWERLNGLGSLEGLYGERDVARLLVPLFGVRGSDLWEFNRSIQGLHDSHAEDSSDELVSRLDELAMNHGLIPAEDARKATLARLSPEARWALGLDS